MKSLIFVTDTNVTYMSVGLQDEDSYGIYAATKNVDYVAPMSVLLPINRTPEGGGLGNVPSPD